MTMEEMIFRLKTMWSTSILLTISHFGLCLDGFPLKQTFEVTTQYAWLPMISLLKKWYKSPFPALNVHRRDEPLATDTIYLDTLAVDSGITIAQVFAGVVSLVTDVYAIKTNQQFINTLEDQIQTGGAPIKLISDRAQVKISNQVNKILHAYCINDWQS